MKRLLFLFLLLTPLFSKAENTEIVIKTTAVCGECKTAIETALMEEKGVKFAQLNSKTKEFPNGLANGSGLVGRNYMVHNNTHIAAVDPTRPDSTPVAAPGTRPGRTRG